VLEHGAAYLQYFSLNQKGTKTIQGKKKNILFQLDRYQKKY